MPNLKMRNEGRNYQSAKGDPLETSYYERSPSRRTRAIREQIKVRSLSPHPYSPQGRVINIQPFNERTPEFDLKTLHTESGILNFRSSDASMFNDVIPSDADLSGDNVKNYQGQKRFSSPGPLESVNHDYLRVPNDVKKRESKDPNETPLISKGQSNPGFVDKQRARFKQRISPKQKQEP